MILDIIVFWILVNLAAPKWLFALVIIDAAIRLIALGVKAAS